MITRFRVNGFKNLRNVDLRFSEFTCIAGPNGSGKSNLFDAIQFLSLTASRTVLEAALSIRGDGGRLTSPEHIFSHGETPGERRIDFDVDMIVPAVALDDLNQRAQATFTFLRYSLSIAERRTPGSSLPLEIVREELGYHAWSAAAKHLLFKHSPAWRRSLKQVGKSGGTRTFFISTRLDSESSENPKNPVIQRHQDGGSSGKPFPALARTLPRTVLSTSNAAESPTALCARREMESWRFLALESSSLRAPDGFNDPSTIDVHGRHMPATLHRLLDAEHDGSDVASRLASRLAELVENVRSIHVDQDEVRESFSIVVSDHAENRVPARGLSDGTLRFLALAILEEDPTVSGVICLEEPENGIHPRRISAMMSLLRDIAVDPAMECGDDNPLRQVIINTHSPLVVSEVPDDSLIMVVDQHQRIGERLVPTPCFLGLPST